MKSKIKETENGKHRIVLTVSPREALAMLAVASNFGGNSDVRKVFSSFGGDSLLECIEKSLKDIYGEFETGDVYDYFSSILPSIYPEDDKKLSEALDRALDHLKSVDAD